MGILHRLNRALKRFSQSPGPVVGGGTVGAQLDLAEIETAEHEEFDDDARQDDEEESE